jgi:sulfur carrier protein ThiS adenylyltransferase
MDTNERYSRQADFVPEVALQNLQVTVIGIGAIGRNVALQLAAIGVHDLQLVDFDIVDRTNVATQGFREADIGQPKVDTTAAVIREINPQVTVRCIQDRFRPRLNTGQAVFCCVDSITTRGAIWRAIGARVPFWADGRMLGEVMRVLVVAGKQGRDGYAHTLFAAQEAQLGSCTAHSTIYAATIAAGLLVHQFTRWLRNLPVDLDSTVNLLAGEWVVAA